MHNFLQDKTVLITGATSGIGEQLAHDLIAYDIDLILVARREEKLAQLKSKLQEKSKRKVSLLVLDVRDRTAVKNKIDVLLQSHSVDILINNAGLALGLNNFSQGSIDHWDTMIDTNLKGLLYISKALMPHLQTKDTAHIVNVGSMAGNMAYPKGNVYCATKAAVHSLTQGMNADLLATNVKVSSIAPGAVETNFSNIRFEGDDKRADAVYEGFEPLTAQDVSLAIINIINTPKHVNIQHVDIMPTAQRNPYLLAKI